MFNYHKNLMDAEASKVDFSDDKKYIITLVDTTINIKFRNVSIYKSFLDKKFAELDSFQILPNFFDNLYDQKLKELIDSK